ncbi:MAG: hypothetical protein ABIH00_00350 [Armatimonadota bacterium]
MSEIYKNSIINKPVSYTFSEKEQVLRDIMPRIITSSEPWNIIENDPVFINEVILPVFLSLKRKWSMAYNFLKKQNIDKFIIKIIKHKLNLFYGEDKDIASPALNAVAAFDKNTVLINKKDEFSNELLKKALLHEIIHTLSETLIKDVNKKDRLALSDYIKENRPGIYQQIHLLHTNYLNKKEILIDKLKSLYKREDLKKNPSFYYGLFKKAALKHGCWIYPDIDSAGKSYRELIICANITPENIEEFLIHSLSYYFGDKEEKNRLNQYEPKLFQILENEIIPLINNLISPD